MVCIGNTVVGAGPMTEAGMSEFATSLQRSFGSNVALVRSEPLWGQQFGLRGNYGLGVSQVLMTLKLTRPGKGKW